MARLLALPSLAAIARGNPTLHELMRETSAMLPQVNTGGSPVCAAGDETCMANMMQQQPDYMPQDSRAALDLSVFPDDSPELPNVGDCVMATTEIPYETHGKRGVVPPRSTGLVTDVHPELRVDWDGSFIWAHQAAKPEQLSRMEAKVGKLVAVKMPHDAQGDPLVRCLTSSCHVSTPGYGTPVTMETCFSTPSQEFVLPACGHGRIRPMCAPHDCLSVLGESAAIFASCVSEHGSDVKLNANRQLETHSAEHGTLGCFDLVAGAFDSPLAVVPCEQATTQFNFA